MENVSRQDSNIHHKLLTLLYSAVVAVAIVMQIVSESTVVTAAKKAEALVPSYDSGWLSWGIDKLIIFLVIGFCVEAIYGFYRQSRSSRWTMPIAACLLAGLSYLPLSLAALLYYGWYYFLGKNRVHAAKVEQYIKAEANDDN